MLTVALETIVYLGVSLVMMMLGYFIIDLVIPVDFTFSISFYLPFRVMK